MATELEMLSARVMEIGDIVGQMAHNQVNFMAGMASFEGVLRALLAKCSIDEGAVRREVMSRAEDDITLAAFADAFDRLFKRI